MEWISWVADPNVWASLVTLTFLEIVLGIDNVIFISILTGKLPRAQQARARTLGLGLVSIKWLIGLTSPLFVLFSHEFSGKDLILLSGGLFLIAKSTQEIHAKLEGEQRRPYAKLRGGFAQTIIQIRLLDYIYFAMVFATAVEMLNLRLRSKQRQ
jgi:predicted tellurium resistance membrane protein TerC